MREDDDTFGGRRVVGRGEQAAQLRLHAKHREMVPVTIWPMTSRDRSPNASGAKIGL